jgi:type VI secretion system protein ImpK
MATELDEVARRARDAKEAGEGPSASGNLALLYEGLLTGIVRLQASRQHISDGESFRKRTKATLNEIEHVAIPSGYDGQDIKDTHFAVVAFLDSVVLHSNDAVRAEWERKSLQEELFGQAVAGEVFFEKLERFHQRRDSEQLANILEVYLLCLLLGFEGRYSGGLRADLENVVDRTKRRIENIRGRSRQLSPAAVLPTDPARQVPQDRLPDRFRLFALAAIVFTILCFIAFKIDLVWTAEALRSKLP